jgi:hypothetical protein
MSAPKTNIEVQKKRHWGPLLGIAVVLIFAAIITAWFMGWLAVTGDEPRDVDTQIDGRTGEVETQIEDSAAPQPVAE